MSSAFFGPPADMPRRWSEYSLEFKCMFAYHIAMMAMFATGAVPILYELAVAGGLIGLFALVSVRRRRAMGWEWQPLPRFALPKAAGTAVLIGLFAYVSALRLPFDDPHALPWFLGLLGIGLFAVLDALKLLAPGEAAFIALGRPQPKPTAVETAPQGAPAWHATVRNIFGALFLLAWLTGLAAFYFDGVAHNNRSTHRTASQTVAVSDKGATIYLTPHDAAMRELFLTGMMIAIPSVLALGFLLHFGLRVPLFGNVRVPRSRDAD